MSITINTAEEYQEIDGFGGGANLIEEIPDALADFLFTDQGIHLSFCRGERCSTADGILSNHTTVYANDDARTDFTVPGADQINIPKMVARGVDLYYSNMWIPRAWEVPLYSENNPKLAPAHYQNWADTWTSFLNWMYANNLPVKAISLQNEPDFAEFQYEWIFGISYEPLEYYNFVANYLAPAIAASNIPTCKIAPFDLMIESNLAAYMQPFIDNSRLDLVDYITVHSYSGPVSAGAASYGKKVWNTETAVNGPTIYNPSIQDAIANAKRIHENLINGVSAYSQSTLFHQNWTYTTLDNFNTHNYGILGLFDGNNTPIPKRAYIFGQYSRFVRPGFVRVACTGAPADTYVSAYKNGTDVVAVAINESTVGKQLSVGGFGAAQYADVWITDATRNLQGIGSVELTNGGFYYSQPTESVVTFVSKSAPTFEIIAPSNLKLPSGASGGQLKTINGASGGTIKTIGA